MQKALQAPWDCPGREARAETSDLSGRLRSPIRLPAGWMSACYASGSRQNHRSYLAVAHRSIPPLLASWPATLRGSARRRPSIGSWPSDPRGTGGTTIPERIIYIHRTPAAPAPGGRDAAGQGTYYRNIGGMYMSRQLRHQNGPGPSKGDLGRLLASQGAFLVVSVSIMLEPQHFCGFPALTETA